MDHLLLGTLYVLTLLSIASWMDFKAGKISNLIWLGFIPASRFFSFLTVGSSQRLECLQLVISVLAAASLALLFFKLGFFGGADMKAIISISHVFPFQVRPVLSSISTPVWLPLSTLINASLASVSISLVARERRRELGESEDKTPFLPFISLGFIVALAIGDPFTMIVHYLLGVL